MLDQKAVCTKNPKHKQFYASAHVVQDWMVDEQGNWVKTTCNCSEITHSPDSEDVWQCAICGADVKFVGI